MNCKAVIFDLDGVLVDTHIAHAASWQEIARRLHVELSNEELDGLRGVSRPEALKKIACRAMVHPLPGTRRCELLEEKARLFQYHLGEMGGTGIRVAGVELLLSGLKAAGLKVAVASASSHARLILRQAGLRPFFMVISDGEFAGSKKPAPDQFLDVARRLEVAPDRCMVIEDSAVGVEAAKAAGMPCLGIGPATEKAEGLIGHLDSLHYVGAETILKIIDSRRSKNNW